jgi:hypothetical protein
MIHKSETGINHFEMCGGLLQSAFLEGYGGITHARVRLIQLYNCIRKDFL